MVAAAPGSRQADPEEQAGKALRQLRLARHWSQGEVAVRMTAYGYDFHQSTIAKIEAAQRPLRVRELADFAALYGVEIQDLVYAQTRSLSEIEQEIDDVETRLDKDRAAAAAAIADAEAAQKAARQAEAAYQKAVSDLAVLEGRLDALKADRRNYICLEPVRNPALEEGSARSRRSALGPQAAASAGSTADARPNGLRILLGSRLRELRTVSGITSKQAASSIRYSRERLVSVELGQSGIKERDVADLLALYGVTDQAERLRWLEIARRSNAPGWWERYSDILPDWFESYIALEMAAASIRIYESRHIPELLQTDRYSRAVTPQSRKATSAGDLSRRDELRAARKEQLLERSDSTHLNVLLEEAVLQRQVGSKAVMHDQIEYIAQIAALPNVIIQVLPIKLGQSPEVSFRILEFNGREVPDIVYIEQLTNALYLSGSQEVKPYRDVMHQACSLALSPDESNAFLQELLAASRG
jgi:transcriptional regulator with XRE-family HTH domain